MIEFFPSQNMEETQVAKYWYDELITVVTGQETYFKGVKLTSNQPKTRFCRVPALISQDINHPTTMNFLKDIIDSEAGEGYSLLEDGSSPRTCIDYLWNQYKIRTILCLQMPYVVQMVFVATITVGGNFDKEEHDFDNLTWLVYLSTILGGLLILYEFIQMYIQGKRYLTSVNNWLDFFGLALYVSWAICHLTHMHLYAIFIPAIAFTILRGVMTFFKMFE